MTVCKSKVTVVWLAGRCFDLAQDTWDRCSTWWDFTAPNMKDQSSLKREHSQKERLVFQPAFLKGYDSHSIYGDWYICFHFSLIFSFLWSMGWILIMGFLQWVIDWLVDGFIWFVLVGKGGTKLKKSCSMIDDKQNVGWHCHVTDSSCCHCVG